MGETAQEYTARLTGLVGGQDALALMAEAPRRLQGLLRGASARELTWTTSPDRWTITQIAAHLADAEVVGAWRFRSILADDGVAVQAYDQNTWASAFRNDTVPLEESVAFYTALRQGTVSLLRRVDPARRRHAGLHAERGRESIDHVMTMYAGHDLNHFAQIERLLEETRQTR